MTIRIPFLPVGFGRFPEVDSALTDPDGLLAAGLDLEPGTLLEGYSRGVFPWFSEGSPILWWAPSNRMIFDVSTFEPSRSLKKTLRNSEYEIRSDSDFEGTMRACATVPRNGQNGTWIGESMISAYRNLHELGYAHSVETWIDGELAGGLYGVALGRTFFGESMFSKKKDASKIALAHMMENLSEMGFSVVDCQMYTPHLASLGAREISRNELCSRVDEGLESGYAPNGLAKWSFSRDLLRSRLENARGAKCG